MGSASEVDKQWFEEHPTAQGYSRAPLPQEWPGISIAGDVRVTVYKINKRSRVRVLETLAGQRLAEPKLDTDVETQPLKRAA